MNQNLVNYYSVKKTIKTYNQFVNESLLLTPELNELRWKQSDKLAEYIKTHCSKFVNDMMPYKVMLYRGVSSVEKVDMLDIKDVRKDRKSSGVPDFINKGIDDRLEKRFGVRPRTQGVFATSDYKVAASYGHGEDIKSRTAYLFFPIGDYQFFWGEHIFDLYGDTEHLPKEDEQVKKEVLDYLGNEHYKNTDFGDAVNSGNEIIFVCNTYIIVDKSFENALLKRLYY